MLDNDWPKWRTLYQDTVFLLTKTVWHSLQHTSHFVIVTAFNPQGDICTLDKNRLLHQQLLSEVKKIPTYELIGSSKDEKHQEVSVALQCELPKGLQLAKQFNQNAIYRVENDNLMLCATHEPMKTMTTLGSFSGRIRVINQ